MMVPMSYLGLVTVVVDDDNRAIAHDVGDLGFSRIADLDQGHKRWVVVAPPGTEDERRSIRLLLARATTAEQRARVGDQTGHRVSLFLHTDDFDRDRDAFRARGVRLEEESRDEPTGRVAVFCDPSGSRWDHLETVAGADERP